MSKLDTTLTAIAQEQLGIPTLVVRNSDSLDFHEVSVWGVKTALTAAYNAGVDAGIAPPQESSP